GAFHYDGISTLPKGAVLLGRGSEYPNQAFRYGAAVGVQFHPEVTPDLFKKWCDDVALENPELRDKLAKKVSDFQRLDPKVKEGTKVLLSNFIRTIQKNNAH